MPDAILYWNEVALEANRISHTRDPKEQAGPTLSSRALAIVHLAMYDAYAAMSPGAGLKPYLTGLPSAPTTGSAAAAAAGAGYTALVALFPSQKPLFDARLIEFGAVGDPGHAFGVAVAQALLADRQNDPNASDVGYEASRARGRHRPDPDNPTQGFHAPFYGALSKGFAVTARHELDPPPFDNAEYVAAVRQVRGKGIEPDLMGTLPDTADRRTTDETLIGIYWGYDGAAELGTPPRLYNQVVRRLAEARKQSEADNARMFALVNVAMADAGILAWDQKYRHDLWRPVVGIREHDPSMGPAATVAEDNVSDDTDPCWLPLGAPATNSVEAVFGTQTAASFPFNQAVLGRLKNTTPPFPAYPSGHATFGAAAFHMVRLLLGTPPGDRAADAYFAGLDFESDEFNGVSRDNRGTVRPRHLRAFTGGLWDMIVENGRSRVFLGVHWVFDAFAVDSDDELVLSRNVGGVPLGLRIAEDIYAAYRDAAKPTFKSAVPPRPGFVPGPATA